MPGSKKPKTQKSRTTCMRLRISFSKSGSLRYIGHLDLHRLWERTCRRARIPLKYSQGFHPQPKISLGCALPLGFIGEAELVDIQLDEELDPILVKENLQKAAPPGLGVFSIEIIDPRLPALQTQVDSAEYLVEFLDPIEPEQIQYHIDRIVDAEAITRERKGKNYNLRPLILSLKPEKTPGTGDAVISMRLKAAPGATGRPEEVLSEMEIHPESTRITRTALYLIEPEKVT
ncbi:MAG TPA: TIGR03936 family radical SAM-associated protein [Anaerolineales bacterium]|nr:TIGR03936 family radical SAM-associated protein [Anaerolineales bacterium]